MSSAPPSYRSSSNSRSLTRTDTPPLPAWDTPAASCLHVRKNPQSASKQRRPCLLRPPPSPLAMQSLDTSIPLSPRTRSRSSSGSSAASSSGVATPPMKQRSETASELLPVLPLCNDTQLPTESKRTLLNSLAEEVHIVVSRDKRYNHSSRSPHSPTRTTPPRPARRLPSWRRESSPPPQPVESQDLLPPQPNYSRSRSPAESIHTISEAASTPRAATKELSEPPSTPAYVPQEPAFVPSTGKRDSTQRRLSALRGLVGNLDFTQHWSLSEQPEGHQEEDYFWVCAESDPIEPCAIPELGMPLVHNISPERPRSRRQSNSGPSHCSTDQPPPSVPGHEMPTDTVDNIPARQRPLQFRPCSMTSTRPRRQFRSSADILSRTPAPPCLGARQRKEVFDVASSGYSKSLEPASPTHSPTPNMTWRSSLSSDSVHQRLLQLQGPAEIKRQEIIWEMCETEQAFVKSMRTVLRLFAIPLKTPQGKWIQGIPERITELFDLLECITHAHEIAAANQRDMKRGAEVVDTERFIASFKDWVPRLEVHERYLLRFETVVQLVGDNVRDQDSVFGEFVRMQMKEEVLGSMSLGSMLLKPVQRLTKYPLFLRRLLDVTAYPHPYHSEILSLLSITESIILNLQATKAREEDYEELQGLETRLQGLPEGFVLAVRGRKLLGHGSVIRVFPQKDLSPSTSRRTTSLHSSRGSISSTVSSAYSFPWDYSGAFTPSTCRTSAFSVSSSASSYCPPSRSNSFVRTSPQRPSISRSPSSASSFVESRPSTPGSLRLRKKENVHIMLIFTDLVLIVTEVSERGSIFMGKRKTDKSMRLAHEIEGGIGKVAEVKDWSGWQGHSSLFTVTMSPDGHDSSLSTTAFTLPAPGSAQPSNGAALNCPYLGSLQQFLTVLGQTATISGQYGIPEEGGEGKEMLEGDHQAL